MPSGDRRPVAGAIFSKREAILIASVAMTVVATATALLSTQLTLDDAYITFRYALHLAEGYGLGAWNHTGEHVEGYSSPLWTVLLGGAAWLGVDVRIASKVFGTAAALIVMAVLFRRRDDRPAMLTGVFLVLYLPFTFYAASGMEAVAFCSLVTLALVGPAEWQPIVAPLLVATRPEGALVAGVDVLALAWRRERWRWVVTTAIAVGLTFVAIEAHRWVAYGALAPNTYYAKVAGGGIGHVRLGLVYVGSWMLAHAVVVAFLMIGAVAVSRAGDRRGLTCLGLVAAYIVYMASAGGDPPTAFPAWRQFIHVAPAWVLVAMTGLTSVVRDSRWRQVSAAVGLALAADVGVLLVLGGGGPRPGVAVYNAWIASIASPTTTISSSYGGALPFLVDAVHIDALGLNTPYIARHVRSRRPSGFEVRHALGHRAAPRHRRGVPVGADASPRRRPGRDHRCAPPQDDSRDGVVAAVSTRVRLRPQRAVRSSGPGRLSAPRLLGGPSTARHARLRAGRRDRGRGVREPVSFTGVSGAAFQKPSSRGNLEAFASWASTQGGKRMHHQLAS